MMHHPLSPSGVDKTKPDRMEAKMARKNPERDQIAAAAFVKWKVALKLSDGDIARKVGRSAAAIATWRNGTRPMARERDVLQGLTGWHWDSPPGDAYAPDEAPQTQKIRKTRKTRRPSVDSVEALMLANDTLREATASKRALNPVNPADALTLRVCAKALEAETARRQEEIVTVQKTKSVRGMIRGHRDPKEALRFLREHSSVDAALLDTIEAELNSNQTVADS